MFRINLIFIIILFPSLFDTTLNSHARQGITTVKTIGKVKKSTLLRHISNIIKKPVLKTFSSVIKNSLGIIHRNKNTIKNLDCGLRGKYKKTMDNFGNKSIKYLTEGMKKFKYIAPQAVRPPAKKNTQKRAAAQMNGKELRNMVDRSAGFMRGKELRSLINMVSKSRPQLPFLVGGGLMKLTYLAKPPENDDDFFVSGEPIDLILKNRGPMYMEQAKQDKEGLGEIPNKRPAQSTSHTMKGNKLPNDKKNSKIGESQADAETTVTYITFIGIPGLGKSYLSKYIISENILGEDVHIQGVKSDSVWKSIIDRYSNNMAKNDIFKRKGRQYNKKIKGLVEKMCSNLKPGKNVLVIDKCNNGDRTQNDFKTQFTANFNLKVSKVKTIVIVPKTSQPLKHGRFCYAASISLIMNCMLRVIEREEHQTLSGPDDERILLILNFLTSFGNKDSFADIAKNKCGYDCIIEAEFNNQNQDNVIDREQTKDLVKIVRSSPGQFKLENNKEILGYLDQFKEFYKRYKAGKITNDGENLFGYEYTKSWKKTFELIKQSI